MVVCDDFFGSQQSHDKIVILQKPQHRELLSHHYIYALGTESKPEN